jgi:hypothetical protein
MRPARKNLDATVNDWLSVSQAAVLLDTTGYTVLARALRGELAHAFVNSKPVIARASVEAALMAENEGER